jgi:N-acetylmuramoyl-L-alanine amidase
MRFTVKNGKVHEGRRAISFKETPNRSGGFRPEGIVLHDTAGRLDRYSSVNWFLDPTAKASAHFVIERDGEITQMAKLSDKCWHAGRSMFKSRPNVNAFAFGIEIVNLGKVSKAGENVYRTWFNKTYHQGEDGLQFEHVPTPHHGSGHWHSYTEAQIASVLELCRLLRQEYDIRWITTHWDISPGRKVDTNPLFPLEEVRAAIFGGDTTDEEGGVVTIADVNQRRWPSYHDNVIQVIPRTSAVTVLRSGFFETEAGVQEAWSLVKWEGHEGWVNNVYLDFS